MPTEYQCPDCGNCVLVSNQASVILGTDEQLGCNNVEEHDKDKPLVMWPEDYD